MIFLIGGRGFVGSAFARLFERRGLAFQILELDNYQEFTGQSCDILINANGNSSKILATRDPVKEFDASVRSVCDALHRYKFRRYVQCSTCDVYPDVSDAALNREDVAIDPARQSRYGFHKRLAERCVQYEARDHVIVRFGGFVGPNLRKNAIFDILNGGPLWLDPASRLQFLHTDSAAEIVWKLAESAPAGEIFNVCGRGLVTLADVVARSGRAVPVQPDSPTVLYDINIEKVQRYCDVPATADTVFRFVADAQRAHPEERA